MVEQVKAAACEANIQQKHRLVSWLLYLQFILMVWKKQLEDGPRVQFPATQMEDLEEVFA